MSRKGPPVAANRGGACCCAKSKKAVLTWAYIKVVFDIVTITGILLGFYFLRKLKYRCCRDYINTLVDLFCVYLFYVNMQFAIVMFIGLYKGIIGTHEMTPYYRFAKRAIMCMTIAALFISLVSPYSLLWPHMIPGAPIFNIPDSLYNSTLVALELIYLILDAVLVYKIRKFFFVDFTACSFEQKCNCLFNAAIRDLMNNNSYRV